MQDDYSSSTDNPSSDDRQWAMLAHAGSAAGLIFGVGYLGFVAPLVIWIMKKDDSSFASSQAKEALNFQTLIFLINIAMGIFVFLTLGAGICVVIPLAIGLWFVELVLSLIAAFRTYDGQAYRYPNPLRIL